MLSLIYFVLIGLVAGGVAAMVMTAPGISLVRSLVVGVAGALLGGYMFGLAYALGIGLLGSLICAVVGSVVLLYILYTTKG
jgi:uncharacterized membrane protein YeaQ/YmgE (transglycosylase-associated protein family)